MNIVALIGRLTKDPDLSYTVTNQTAKCTFILAVDRPRRSGEEQSADFIRVIVWGRQAENCNRYLSRGRQVAVHGSIRSGSYENAVGVRVYTTDIWASHVEFLGGGQNSERTRNDAPNDAPNDELYTETFKAEAFDDMPDSFSAAEDDIPF